MRLPRGLRAVDAVANLLASGDVVSAQPNYIRSITSAPPPNDFLWVNDTANGFYGVKKIQTNLVWAAPHNNTGSSSVVIADIDTGVKYTHPDLAANMWINPGEIPGNVIDDDANGYIDDVHGINAITHTGNPMDDNGHGTHTAGTFGAVGNNGPQMVTVTAAIAVSDNADPSPAITLVSITANDGKHAEREDVQGAVFGTDDRTFSLRAERGELGAERVYTITYRATDRSGNVTEESANVIVPGRR